MKGSLKRPLSGSVNYAKVRVF